MIKNAVSIVSEKFLIQKCTFFPPRERCPFSLPKRKRTKKKLASLGNLTACRMLGVITQSPMKLRFRCCHRRLRSSVLCESLRACPSLPHTADRTSFFPRQQFFLPSMWLFCRLLSVDDHSIRYPKKINPSLAFRRQGCYNEKRATPAGSCRRIADRHKLHARLDGRSRFVQFP